MKNNNTEIQSNENIKENKILNIINKIKQNKLIVLISIILIVLVLFSLFFNSSSKSVSEKNNDEVSIYISNLEKKLKSTLNQVEGAGHVDVIINVESGMETVLAMKTTTTESSGKIEIEETPILVNGKTVVLKYLYPEITGVVIVCQGANNIAVLNKIEQATVSLLNVNKNKIEILKMK